MKSRFPGNSPEALLISAPDFRVAGFSGSMTVSWVYPLNQLMSNSMVQVHEQRKDANAMEAGLTTSECHMFYISRNMSVTMNPAHMTVIKTLY